MRVSSPSPSPPKLELAGERAGGQASSAGWLALPSCNAKNEHDDTHNGGSSFGADRWPCCWCAGAANSAHEPASSQPASSSAPRPQLIDGRPPLPLPPPPDFAAQAIASRPSSQPVGRAQAGRLLTRLARPIQAHSNEAPHWRAGKNPIIFASTSCKGSRSVPFEWRGKQMGDGHWLPGCPAGWLRQKRAREPGEGRPPRSQLFSA